MSANHIQRSPAPEAHQPIRRHAGLDVLRFAAAFAVLLYHFLYRGAADGEFLPSEFQFAPDATRFAYFGLHLFFLVSGFVILWTAQNRDWFSFGMARLIRLWPGYAACVAITALTTWLYATTIATEPFAISWAMVAANFTFVAPAFGHPFMDGVYWTIVLELIFYFWVALAIFTGLLPRHLIGFCIIWLGLIAANELWLDNGTMRLALVTRYGAWFVLGMLAYDIRQKGITIPSFICLFFAITLSMDMALAEHIELAALYGYAFDPASIITANAFILTLFAIVVAWGDRLPSTAAVTTMGALTYPLYLVHQHVGYMIINTTVSSLGAAGSLMCATTVVILIAWAIWRFIEVAAQSAAKTALRHTALQPLDYLRRMTAKSVIRGIAGKISRGPRPGKRALQPAE
ncbi:MAG: acyltransferase [Pseudomonadota bacterium]